LVIVTKNIRKYRLLEPGSIGSLQLKNRIIKVGAHPGFYKYNGGLVQHEVLDYYEALARGGAGLIVVGPGLVEFPAFNTTPRGYSVSDDMFVPGLRELSGTIKKYDCPVLMQIFTPGPMVAKIPGAPRSVAASEIPEDELPIPWIPSPRELTVPEITELIQKYIDTAARIKDAGFNGIELNAACFHLLNSFLSLAWNRRQDIYGKHSLGSRAKILVDIIKGIKQRNGEDFVIIALINGAEPGLENGITPQESCGIARILESAGADAVEVRAEMYTHTENPKLRDSTHFPDMAVYPEVPFVFKGVDTSHNGQAGWAPLAKAVKQCVNIPVISVGRLDINQGEKLLRRKSVDFIGMNRAFLADNELPLKLKEGRVEDIVPCTGCMLCYDNLEHDLPPRCCVNASLGKERSFAIKKAEKVKNVLVVGGGPAGLEAARVAALRGHRVLIYDKHRRLGGSLNMAAIIKGCDHEDLTVFSEYLTTQVTKLGAEVVTRTEITPEIVDELKPDVIIIATGGIHQLPDIPGIEKNIVISSKGLYKYISRALKYLSVHQLNDLTDIWMPLGRNIVIIGGGVNGCQTAAFLVKRGRKVTVLDSAPKIGEGLIETLCKPHMLAWLAEKGVKMEAGVTFDAITDKGIMYITADGQRRTLKAGNIITALPLIPDDALYNQIKDKAPEVYKIGDCNSTGTIADAVADGSRIAREI